MESIPKTDRQIQSDIRSLLGRLGSLQTEAVIRYALAVNPGRSRESIEYLLNGLRLSGGAFFTEHTICPSPGRRIESDMAVAFWVFQLFAQKAQGRFLAANWPSSIIFKSEEDALCRITVCRSAAGDENLTILKNKRWDGVFHEIIAGVNLAAEETDADLLPKGVRLTFVSVRCRDLLSDIPDLTVKHLEKAHA